MKRIASVSRTGLRQTHAMDCVEKLVGFLVGLLLEVLSRSARGKNRKSKAKPSLAGKGRTLQGHLGLETAG